MKIYVGNLPFSITQDEFRALFAAFGTVVSADIIMDKFSGRSKGFGFVEMSDDAQAEAAIAALDGKDSGGRALKVNKALPKTDKPRDGGGFRDRNDRPRRDY